MAGEPGPGIGKTGSRRQRVPLLAALALSAIGAVVLALSLLGRDGGGADTVALKKGVSGPAVVVDSDGLRYELPDNWAIADVITPAGQRSSAIRSAAAVVRVRATRNRHETASDVARDAGGVACPVERQEKVHFGGADAIRCVHIPLGRLAKPGEETVAYYAHVAGVSWILRIDAADPAIPAASPALNRFLASVRFTKV